MSRRQDLRDAAIAALNAAPPTGVPACTKRRFIPGEQLREPRLAAFFAEEEARRPAGAAGPITHRGLTLVIQAMTTVEDPEDADDAIEPMLEHIVAVMGDTNLGGLALNVLELGTLWAASNEGGRVYVVALTRWKLDFQTKRNDLTSPH